MVYSCCVKGCRSTNKQNKKSSTAFVRFHAFPTKPMLRAKWLKAIGCPSWDPPNHARVCSLHFNDSQIKKNSKTLKLLDNAYPAKALMMNADFGANDLEICRTCLALDVKMYSLQNKLLKDCNKVLAKFNENMNGLPEYMCYECVALIIKSNNFIQKSINSRNVLVNIYNEHGVISKDLVRNINTSKSNLTFNKVTPSTFYDMQYDEDLNKYHHIIVTTNNTECNGIIKTECPLDSDPPYFVNHNTIKTDNCEVMINNDVEIDDKSYLDVDDDKADDGSYDSEENLTLSRIKDEVKMNNVKKKKPLLKRKITKTRNSLNKEEVNLEKYFKIVKLTLEEQITDRQKMKQSPAYRDALYRCEICYRTYLNPDSFKHHVAQHHSSRGNHECPVCKIRYASESLARCHATRAHGKIFYCKLCPKRFVTSFMAKKHHQRHEGRTYTCSDCDFSSIHESALYNHIKCRHGTPFKCSECGHRFRSEKGLGLHVAKVHGINQSPKVESICICYNCGKNFMSDVMLQKHTVNCRLKGMADSEENNAENSNNDSLNILSAPEHFYPLQCEHCGETLNSRKERYFHVRKYHRNQLVSYQPVITAVCTTCGRGFQNATKLHMHELRHRGRPTVQCPYCPRLFYDKYQLARHVGVHSDDRPHKCSVCEKTFKLKSNMTRHQQVHSSAFPHECNMCGKRFSYTSSRNLHIKTVHYKMPQPPRKKKNNKCARTSAAVNSYESF